MHLKT